MSRAAGPKPKPNARSDLSCVGAGAAAGIELLNNVLCIEAEIDAAGAIVVFVVVPILLVVGTTAFAAAAALGFTTAVVNSAVVVDGGSGVGTGVGFGVGDNVGARVVSVAPINTLIRAFAAPPLFSAKIW